jgi:regulator of nucleoside diphosphate kinase
VLSAPNRRLTRNYDINFFTNRYCINGYKTGDEIEWIIPAGLTKIRIDEIIYQPEAAGHHNL